MAISQNFPNIPPSLLFDFAKSKKLDSRITFTRGSTGTYVDDHGLIRTAGINEARFDHDPNTLKSLGLLIEESRTNLQVYSGIPSANWSGWLSPTVTNNAAVSPDGSTNATQISSSSAAGGLYQFTTSLTSGTAYTYSLFVKAVSGTNTIFFGSDSGTSATVQVNTSTGVASTYIGSPTNITSTPYPNGWYRISFTFTAGTTATHSFIIYNLTANANTWLAYGAQVEAGRFATSYIPTVASTVTRSLDLASLTGTNFSSWFNPSEGTTFISYVKYYQQTQFDISLYPTLFSIGAWPTRIDYADFGGVYQTMNAVISGTFQADLYGSSTRSTNTTLKFIGAYKTDDFAAIGTERVLYTDTSGSVPTGFTAAYIGSEGLASNSIHNGHIAQLSYYPRRLSNTYLQELTK